MSEQVEQGITREQAMSLASDVERPILEILLRGGVIKTNRGMLEAAREIANTRVSLPEDGKAVIANTLPSAGDAERVRELMEKSLCAEPSYDCEEAVSVHFRDLVDHITALIFEIRGEYETK